jgi:hypothetical protein
LLQVCAEAATCTIYFSSPWETNCDAICLKGSGSCKNAWSDKSPCVQFKSYGCSGGQSSGICECSR